MIKPQEQDLICFLQASSCSALFLLLRAPPSSPLPKESLTLFKCSISKSVAKFSGFHCFLDLFPLHTDAAVLASHLDYYGNLPISWLPSSSTLPFCLSLSRYSGLIGLHFQLKWISMILQYL